MPIIKQEIRDEGDVKPLFVHRDIILNKLMPMEREWCYITVVNIVTSFTPLLIAGIDEK